MRQYQQAMQWLKQKLNVRYLIEGGGPRKEIWEIPELAFKEAIINALSHRDYYDKGARTTIELFADRVEITNPGGLVSAISPHEFGTKSHSRNPLLFGLFERLDMVEQIGSGITRIKNLMLEQKLPLPEFKTEGMFTVVFQRSESWVKTGVETREKTREKIIKLIGENNKITTSELSENKGLSIKGVEYQLNKLKKEKIIERIGGDKGGYWLVRKLENN
jgi:ATP-dependent DNA helicase RecG